MGCSGSSAIEALPPKEVDGVVSRKYSDGGSTHIEDVYDSYDTDSSEDGRVRFQVELEGEFRDYDTDEDAILMCAFLVGLPKATYTFRTFEYEVDFEKMIQINVQTCKERRIRAPPNVSRPAKPILPPGPMTVVAVPDNCTDRIEVADLKTPGRMLTVMLPAGVQPGMDLAVPLPEHGEAPEAAARRHSEWRQRRGLVAAGIAGVSLIAGAILGESFQAEDTREFDFHHSDTTELFVGGQSSVRPTRSWSGRAPTFENAEGLILSLF